MVIGPPRKGLKVTYCTDTRPVPVITEQAAGSDLLILEGMYGDPEDAEKAKQKKTHPPAPPCKEGSRYKCSGMFFAYLVIPLIMNNHIK